jgi:hypothetical protein
MDRLRSVHGDLGTGQLNRLMLDLERFDRLHKLGHLASDPDPVVPHSVRRPTRA